MSRKPVMLIVLDGWGIRDTAHGNAVAQARTPNLRPLAQRLRARHPAYLRPACRAGARADG